MLLDDFLGVGQIDFLVLLCDTSWPGGLRGAVKSAEASFEAEKHVIGLGAAGTLMENLEGSLFLKELT